MTAIRDLTVEDWRKILWKTTNIFSLLSFWGLIAVIGILAIIGFMTGIISLALIYEQAGRSIEAPLSLARNSLRALRIVLTIWGITVFISIITIAVDLAYKMGIKQRKRKDEFMEEVKKAVLAEIKPRRRKK